MYHDAVPSIPPSPHLEYLAAEQRVGFSAQPCPTSNRPTCLNSPAKTPTYREYFARVRPERQ